MKILFIYPDLNIDVNWKGCYSEGVGSLSSFLKAKGHHVELAHIYNLDQDKGLLDRVSGFDIVSFSSTTVMFPYVQYCSKRIKERYSKLPLLCGGSHATGAPADTLKTCSVDFVCVGEGEYFMLDFIDYLEGRMKKEDIKNLAYRNDSGDIIANDLRPPINPIDDLPFADRTIFRHCHEGAPEVSICAGRGCPFQCSYCSNYHLNKIYNNKYLRFKKPETVIEEIKSVLNAYPNAERIVFIDDVFIFDKKWLEKFCDMYKREIKLPYFAEGHPLSITDEKVKLLKESGCNEVYFGIQSGNEYIRNEIMLRSTTDKQIEGAVHILKKYGIKFPVDVIFGVPMETKSQMMDTIKFFAKNDITARPHIFYPFPSTKLEETAVRMGLYERNTFVEDFYSSTVLKFPLMHKMRIVFFQLYCNNLIKLFRRLAYSKNNLRLRKWHAKAAEAIFCNDVVILSVVSARYSYIKLRSLIRAFKGVKEYRVGELSRT